MYRQPMYTGKQKCLEQPNFCSSFIDKIWSHKRSPDVRDRGKSPEKKKLKSDSNEKSEFGKGNKKGEIKSIIAKLKKVTSTLPWALRSNDAYSTGENSCEVCSMTRDKYKSDLNSAKVIGILVDGVIEREQAEKMDEENEQDLDEGNDKVSKDNGKGDKISFNFSVYCEGDVIKHSLKCVLIRLQKTIGDIMVQICFVKTRKLGNEEKYKKFDVSISDLKLLKYEYTNLTDTIIPLFKSPAAKKKSSAEVCVACVKEKLSECNLRLSEILKSGRNLRVVMRNEGMNHGADKCCSRDYPHVHAEVQGKPIVLKYSMPFQVKPSSKSNEPSDEQRQTDPSGRPIPPQKTPSGHLKEAPQEQDQPEVPYYEWPEDTLYPPEATNDTTPLSAPPNDTTPLSAPPDREYASDTDNLDSPEDNPEVPQEALHPTDDFISPKPAPESSETSISLKPSTMSSATSLSSNKSQESTGTKSSSPFVMKPNTATQVAAPVLSKTSLFSTDSAKSKTAQPQKPNKKLSTTEESDSTESKSTLSKMSSKSSLYCGCNYDKAFEKLGFQPNPKQIKSEDLTSSFSESSSSFLKEDPKTKTVTFPYKLHDTTAFPMQAKQSNVMFPKHSSQADYSQIQQQLPEKNANDIPVSSVHKVDSLVLTKERWSHGGEPSKGSLLMVVSPEDKAVAAAFKTFIDEPKYESVRDVTTDSNYLNLHKESSHQHKKMELLKHLGRDNLLSVCSPAECCKVGSDLDVRTSYSELPLSPSLDSLPLDHTDLEYLGRATGKPISYEDLMLIAEEEVPAKNTEWEVQFADRSNDPYKPRWLRAFGETDDQQGTSTSVPQTSSAVRRSSVKSVIIKDEPTRLSTIVEEGPFCFLEDEQPSIPYMPSIPSLPLEEEEKAELLKKCRPSILKHTTMELRYFTVEFPDDGKKKVKLNKEDGKLNSTNPQENKKLCFEGGTGNKTNKIVKSSALVKAEVDKKSCDSFHSCSSSTELMNVNYDQMERQSATSNEELFKMKADEITMLNAIHLCDNRFDYYGTCFKSSKTSISKNCVQDIVHYNNVASSQKNPKVSDSRTSYIGCIPEINDSYVKNLISNEDKTQRAGMNKSYTVIKNTETKTSSCDRMGDTISRSNAVSNFTDFDKSCSVDCDKTEQSREPLRTTKCAYNNSLTPTKALITADSKYNLSTSLNTAEKKTSDSKIISINENKPKYISVKLNQSYTVVKDDVNKEFSYKMDNKPQVSYTVIKEKEIKKTSYGTDDIVEKEATIINYSDMKDASLKTPIASLKFKSNTTPQFRTNIQSNWAKLKFDKTNVKDYVNEQRNSKHITSMHETKIKHYKDCKRKPLILPQSRLSCRRMQCKVALPRTYFPNIQPLRINYRIPSIILVPSNKLNSRLEPIAKSNLIKQQISNTEEVHSSDPSHIENKCKNKLKPEPEHPFVQRIENKSNFKDINPVDRVVRRDLSENPEFNMPSIYAKTGDYYSNNLNAKTHPIEDNKSFRFCTIKSNTNLKCPQIKSDDCKIDEHLLIDQDYNPLYLFDCHGRPLTDQSGRTLRNIKGEYLIVFDEQHSPICDLDNNPICDSLGHILNKKGFNSVKPPIEDVLKSFLRDSGDPILLYDTEGRPLTSVSGTMLVDSSGKSLIRFECTDKQISDSIGRPIFNSTGEKFNGVA